MVARADSLINTDIKKTNEVLGLGLDTYEGPFLGSLLGWIITALAISLGAPFWYDLLNKFMKLRGSGSTPVKVEKETKQ